jgi:hypothetical protein
MKLENAPYDLVGVVWDDAEVDSGWDKVEEPTESLVLTVGYLVKKTRAHLVIAASITTGEYNTNQRIKIPKGMVKQITVIKEKAP